MIVCQRAVIRAAMNPTSGIRDRNEAQEASTCSDTDPERPSPNIVLDQHRGRHLSLGISSFTDLFIESHAAKIFKVGHEFLKHDVSMPNSPERLALSIVEPLPLILFRVFRTPPFPPPWPTALASTLLRSPLRSFIERNLRMITRFHQTAPSTKPARTAGPRANICFRRLNWWTIQNMSQEMGLMLVAMSRSLLVSGHVLSFPAVFTRY